MTGTLHARQLVVLTGLLVAGLAGTVAALADRSADAQFLQDQRHPPSLKPFDVEHVVQSAPDPATGKGSGISATCTRGGSGQFGNPWSCVVRYASGKRVRLSVRINPDGTYTGRYRGVGGGGATGCCIDLPGTR